MLNRKQLDLRIKYGLDSNQHLFNSLGDWLITEQKLAMKDLLSVSGHALEEYRGRITVRQSRHVAGHWVLLAMQEGGKENWGTLSVVAHAGRREGNWDIECCCPCRKGGRKTVRQSRHVRSQDKYLCRWGQGCGLYNRKVKAFPIFNFYRSGLWSIEIVGPSPYLW